MKLRLVTLIITILCVINNMIQIMINVHFISNIIQIIINVHFSVG